MIVPLSKFLHSTIFEGVLIVEDELLPLINSKAGKGDVAMTIGLLQ